MESIFCNRGLYRKPFCYVFEWGYIAGVYFFGLFVGIYHNLFTFLLEDPVRMTEFTYVNLVGCVIYFESYYGLLKRDHTGGGTVRGANMLAHTLGLFLLLALFSSDVPLIQRMAMLTYIISWMFLFECLVLIRYYIREEAKPVEVISFPVKTYELNN